MRRIVAALLLVLLAAPSWAMENHADFLRNQRGVALGGATVTVYIAGTTTLATIYSDNGVTTKANPFTTDIYDGRYNFYAANGAYDLTFRYQSVTFDPGHSKRITLFDPTDGVPLAAALAANGTNCSAGQAAAGVDASGNAEGCFTPAGGGGGGGSGTIVGSTGSVDNAIIRADGVAGVTIQSSTATIDDSGNATVNTLATTGGALGMWTPLEGAAPGAATNANEHNIYVDSTTNRLASHENGGTAKDYVDTASTQTLTGKSYDAEAAGNVLTMPRRIWFPAAGCAGTTPGPVWDLPATNAAVATCVTGGQVQRGVLDFANGTNLSAQISYKLPSTWTGNIDLTLIWFSSTTTGSVVWQTRTSCSADGESGDPGWGSSDTFAADVTKGTANQLNYATDTNILVAGCAAGEELHLELTRNQAHASDDMAGTARLVGLEMVIRESL